MSDTSSEPYDPPMEPLHGDSNFYIWKSVILLHLGSLGLDNIVLGTAPRPPTLTSFSSSSTPPEKTHEQTQWDVSSAQAIIFIYNRLEPSLQALISFSSTAPEIWQTLMQRYHQHEPVMLMRSLQAITNLRLGEDESIAEHLKEFEDAWFDLRMRTEDGPPVVEGAQNTLETVLSTLAKSEQCKAEVLINSLSMDLLMLGYNLREHHGAELRSWHVSLKLTEMHEIQKRIKAEEEEEEALEDCTWCRSRGYGSAGHTWKECRRLRRFKKQEKANARGRRA